MFNRSSYLVTQRKDVGRHKDKHRGKNGSMESLVVEDWQAEKSLVECNRYMLKNQLACDITFRVGEAREKIGAHKYVLASRSSTFFMLMQGLTSENKDEMDIVEVEPEIFRLMLNYMYCDEVALEDETAMSLLYCAKKYSVRALVKHCVKHVEASLKPQNVCDILDQSYAYEERLLQDKALNYILQHGEEVLKSDGLVKLSQPCLMAVLGSDSLRADELSVFRAAMTWASKHCDREGKNPSGENKREALGEAIFLIRFLLLSQKDFVEHVSTQNVLTAEEKCEVLECLAVSGKSSAHFSGKARDGKPATEL